MRALSLLSPSLRPALVLWSASCAFLSAADWSRWRGEGRDGHSADSSGWESGAWAQPSVLWSATAGEGSSSPVTRGGAVYLTGREKGQEIIRCLDLASGTERWSHRYHAPQYGRHATGDQGMYSGPSATPELDAATGFLYTMGIDGELQCRDTAAAGKLVWRRNLMDDWKIPQRPRVTDFPNSLRDYGCPAAPVVSGELLLVEAGDPAGGNLKALDKLTGRLRWSSQNRDPAGHTAGPVLLKVENVPCAAVLTARNLVVTRLDPGHEGRTVTEFPWVTDFINNIASPVVTDDGLIITSRYNKKSMIRLRITLGGAEPVWRSADCSGVCSPVILGDSIYWASDGLYCLDLETGKRRWQGSGFGEAASCLATADDRLIFWGNDGDLALVENSTRSPGALKVLSWQKGLLHDMAWPHVVLADDRLLVKDRTGRLKCLALSSAARAAAPLSSPLPGDALTKVDLRHWLDKEPEALVLGWTQGGGKRGLMGRAVAAKRAFWETAGEARFTESGILALSAGAVRWNGDEAALSSAFRNAPGFTLEAVIRCADTEHNGPARILTFSEDAYHRNFTLGQERDQFVLRLRTTATGDNGASPETVFGTVEAGVLTHLLVTWRSGEVAAWINGQEAFRRTGWCVGDLSNWTPQHFLAGDEHDGGRSWAGEIHGFALSAEFITPHISARRWADFRAAGN